MVFLGDTLLLSRNGFTLGQLKDCWAVSHLHSQEKEAMSSPVQYREEFHFVWGRHFQNAIQVVLRFNSHTGRECCAALSFHQRGCHFPNWAVIAWWKSWTHHPPKLSKVNLFKNILFRLARQHGLWNWSTCRECSADKKTRCRTARVNREVQVEKPSLD